MKTPLGWAASRWELSARALRWATTAALLVSIVIVFTGGLVRVTGSGLGCPTWPTCDGTSIATTDALGIHGLIEFGNRLLTGLVIVVVGWVIIAARLQRPHVRWVSRLAWSQFWLVFANAVAGGITVLVGLNPWVVALHFVLAIALIATTTFTWHRVRESTSVPLSPSTVRPFAWLLALGTLLLVVLGTLVTGTGPHSGDSSDVPRMAFDWPAITWVHGIVGALVLLVAVVMIVRVGRVGRDGRDALVRRRLFGFAGAVVVQGALGIVQSLIGLPETVVAVHVLGSAIVWVGALRVLLDADPLLFARARVAAS